MNSENGGGFEPDYESLRHLLLEMPQRRTVDGLLGMVVERLAEYPYVALARVWLQRPGDICEDCSLQAECLDRTVCLHLVASAGQSTVMPDSDWSRIDGAFRRFPYGVRKVGRVAATREPVAVIDTEEDASWIARPDWAHEEGIRGFGGVPICVRDELLGVLGIFTRTQMNEEWLSWMRVVADHCASAIANAEAFEEIEQLREHLQLENELLREEVTESKAFGEIVGASPALLQVERQIELVAPTDASVLIQGESGTGKELVARAIHRRSNRASEPMIKVNCASIPRELYESEFFGHVKGAFTGAIKDRMGRFHAADGGTLLLDEIGEIPLPLQAKLLRVLQEGEYERVGEERTRSVGVRIIAATNSRLADEVEAGRFRADLYYRLNVFPIEVPPLRDRLEDIPSLAAHFVKLVSGQLRVKPPRMSWANTRELQAYDWPGNVRELQNVIERAVIVSRDGQLRFQLAGDGERKLPQVADDDRGQDDEPDVIPDAEMKRRVRGNIVAALEQADWRVYGPEGAAELLGIAPTTLSSRMKALRISKPR